MKHWRFRLADVFLATAVVAVGCWTIPPNSSAETALSILAVHAAAAAFIALTLHLTRQPRERPPQRALYSETRLFVRTGASGQLLLWLFIVVRLFSDKIGIVAPRGLEVILSFAATAWLLASFCCNVAAMFLCWRLAKSRVLLLMAILNLAIPAVVLGSIFLVSHE